LSAEVVIGDLDASTARQARALMDRAFDGDFADGDWEHAVGGHHAVVVSGGLVLAHAAVVRRTLWVDDRPVATGYVEAVATSPEHQGEGHGTAAMQAIADLIARHHEIGVLSTGEHRFYERLGWQRWQGPTYVRRADGDERSEEDDDGIMVLLHPRSPAVDLTARLTCEERPGDDW
jgi:aminoglycoside 2'-N-acetyltransferase I